MVKQATDSSRRRFLKRAGTTGLGLGVALAGCIGDGGGGADGGDSDDAGGGDGGDGGNGGTVRGENEMPVLRWGYTGGAAIASPSGFLVGLDHLAENVLPNVGTKYKLEITQTQGTSLTASAMGAGEIDGGVLAYSSGANAIAQEVVSSGLTITHPEVWYGPDFGFSDPYASLKGSGITDFEDLRGTRFATNAAGSGSDIGARVGMLKHGIDPRTDVNMVEVGFGAMASALRQGRIDVGTFVQPLWESIREEAQIIYSLGTAFGNFLPFFGTFRNDFIENNTDLITWYIEDYWEAAHWVYDEQNRDKAVEIFSNSLETEPDLMETVLYERGYTWAGKLDGLQLKSEFIQPGIDGMRETGYLDSDINISEYIDNSYLPDGTNQVPSNVK